MTKLENFVINKILINYFKKNKKLPPYGRYFVKKNILRENDILDYFLENEKNEIYIKYTYYPNLKNENKFMTSSFKLFSK